MKRYIPILGYHKIGAHKGDHVPTVIPEVFEQHLAFLKQHRFEVWPVERLVGALAAGQRLPPRVTAITFDDGYAETYTVAWPLLKRFGFPATVFVATAEVGLPGFITWAQLREIAADGFTIGSHTVHHTYVPRAATALVQEEFRASKQQIEQAVGRSVAYLSYPVGGFTTEAQQLAREAGYAAAFTTNRTFHRNGLDLFAIRRIKMTDKDVHLMILWAKLSGFYDYFRHLPAPA
jgi:peptidoglycan/xylan/chitin deacetylase (PgdA/CDA1 family)